MKSILLLRHAKSDWDAAFNTDHERPVSPRGRKAAGKMGRLLTAAQLVPDHAVTSSAVRAHQTLYLAHRHGQWDLPVYISDTVYRATASDVLQEIRNVDDGVEIVILVGHEPSLSQAVGTLIGGGRVEMKTAACARIDVGVDRWEDVQPGMGILAFLVPPSLIRPQRYLRLKRRPNKDNKDEEPPVTGH